MSDELCRFLSGSAVLLLCLACTTDRYSTKARTAGRGPLEIYQEQDHPLGDETASVNGPRADSEQGKNIQAIGLELTSCYGYCPEFTALFCADGSAWYCGRANTNPLGCHSGSVTLDEYRIVAAAMDDIGYFEMNHTYVALETDESSVLVFGKRYNKIKMIRDYAESGPPRLWLLEFLLGAMVDRIHWSPSDVTGLDLERCSSP